jgi:hypothetical protein
MQTALPHQPAPAAERERLGTAQVCKSLLGAVQRAAAFWKKQCWLVGFRQLYESTTPHAWEPLDPPGGSWCAYYCARMQQRYRVR